MIFCKSCGYEGSYLSKLCPSCKTPLQLDEFDLNIIRESIEEAKRHKESETVTEGYHILADFGDTDGEREWARILERGDGVPRDADAAMDFYRRAAEKFDALAAYKYSELLSRINKDAGRFWLEFSAFLEYPRAYLEAAKSHLEGREVEFCNHYLYLAALSDDTDAIVLLAERYFSGEGLPARPDYAKWYMDKLNFPPFYAFKLSLKLRGVKAAEAPNISLHDKKALAVNLLGKARKLGFSHPVFYLSSYLFDNGDTKAGAELGEMYLAGYGTRQSSEEGIRALTRAAAAGSASAYLSLARAYFEGVHTERSIPLSLRYFEKAGELGLKEGYEALGDIYHAKDFRDLSIPTALSYYLKAADMGSEAARSKADKILEVRELFYRKAVESEKTDAKESFKNRIASAAMGHPGGKLLLAEAYAVGIGTAQNRQAAFSLWRSAADDDVDKAYFPLGLCYSYGFGTAFDFDKAIRAFTIADRRGEIRAKEEAKRLIENKKRAYAKKFYSTAMRLVYIGKFGAAAGYLEAAKDLSYPKAIYTLGCLYEFAKGVPQDKTKAYRLYDEADKLGFLDNRSKYKLTILKMLKK